MAAPMPASLTAFRQRGRVQSMYKHVAKESEGKLCNGTLLSHIRFQNMAGQSCFRAYLLNQARLHLATNNYGSAFSHYLLAVKINHELPVEIHDETVSCIRLWTDLLHTTEQFEELLVAFSQARAVCSFSDTLMCALAEQALRLERLDSAISLVHEAEQSFPQSVIVQETREHVSYGAVERWHFKMLNDFERNKAYHDAIVATLKENHLKSVLDIGCGTGLLSVFAAKGGAATVTLCDAAPVMTEIASAVTASHKHTLSSCKFRVFDAHSTSLCVPEHLSERVDLVVTEIFDAALFGEHCLSTLSHAWSHLLHNNEHKKGRVIPRAAYMYVSAIECPEIRKENSVNPTCIPLLNLRDVSIVSRTSVMGNDPYTTEDLFSIRHSYRFLSPVVSFISVDFNDPHNLQKLSSHVSTFTLDIYAEGTVDALAVWFDLDLCEGVKVSTAPSDGCCWEQAIFPVVLPQNGTDRDDGTVLQELLNVKCGDQLRIHCRLNDGCLRLNVNEIIPLGYFLNFCHISRGPAVSVLDTSSGNGHIGEEDVKKLSTFEEVKESITYNDSEMEGMHCTQNMSDPSAQTDVDCLVGNQPTICQCSALQNMAIVNGNSCANRHESCPFSVGKKGIPAGSQTRINGCLFQDSTLPTESCQNDSHEQSRHECRNRDMSSRSEARCQVVNAVQLCKDKQHVFSVNEVNSVPCDNNYTTVNMNDDTITNSRHTEPSSLSLTCKNECDIVHTAEKNEQESSTLVVTDSSDFLNTGRCQTQQLCSESQPTQNDTQSKLCSYTLYLHREEIRRLNDSKFNSLYLTALQHILTGQKPDRKMLYVSTTPPLHGLLGLKLGPQAAADLCYIGLGDSQQMKDVVDCVGGGSGLDAGRWRWCGESVEDVVDGYEDGEQLDVVSLDVVEMTGSLRGALVDELRTLRSIANEKVTMLPQTVDVYAVLIDSPQLLSMSRVTCDNNTLGVRIEPHINPFQTRTFLDLDIHTLPHENLSDVIHVFHLDLQSCLATAPTCTQPKATNAEHGTESASSSTNCDKHLESVFSQSKQLSFSAQKSGHVTAVVFWFDMCLAPGVNASTVDADLNWKQAAFVLNGGKVEAGQTMLVKAQLEKSYLHFSLV